MAIPPPNTAVLLSKIRTPLAFICVLSSVTPPPMLLRNVFLPLNVIGNLKAAIALVSLVSPSDVLLVKSLCVIRVGEYRVKFHTLIQDEGDKIVNTHTHTSLPPSLSLSLSPHHSPIFKSYREPNLVYMNQ